MAEIVFYVVAAVGECFLFRRGKPGNESHDYAMRIVAGVVLWLLLFFVLTAGIVAVFG